MNYDIEKIHAECVKWFEAGVLEPWMEFAGIDIKVVRRQSDKSCFGYGIGNISLLPREFNAGHFRTILVCARLIGIDLETYRC